MKLTHSAVSNAKPKDKPYKMFDGEGLFLQVHPDGKKYWRLKYRYQGKEKLYAVGVYPRVSLKEARANREEMKKKLDSGQDPMQERKKEKLESKSNHDNNFEAIAREWHEHQKDGWMPIHTAGVMRRLERDIFPHIGQRPIREITAPELLAVIRKIESRGALDVAKRGVQTSGQIFRYAIATGRAERDPSRDLRGALKTTKVKNRAYIAADALPEFLAKLKQYDGEPLTRLALELLILTFVRSAELRGAKWSEFNFDKAEWRIPAERMKMKEQHIVPLCKQALAVIEQIKPHSADSDYLFPQIKRRNKIMSENTLLYALYRMGYHSRATVHGFRSTASTVLNEEGFRKDAIERQLAHGERSKIVAAYNHAQYLPERRDMMQWWGGFVETQGAKK